MADLQVFKEVRGGGLPVRSTLNVFQTRFLLSVIVKAVPLPGSSPQEVKQQDFFVGTVRVNGRMDWPMLDSAVSQALKVRRSDSVDGCWVGCGPHPSDPAQISMPSGRSSCYGSGLDPRCPFVR